jgi:MFS family permease
VRAIGRALDGIRGPAGSTADPEVRSIRDDIREGVVFVVRHPGVRTMTLVGTLQCLAGGGFVALMVVWCARVLDIGTSGWRFAVVFSVWSVGGILASAALPRLLRRMSAGRVTLVALPVASVFAILTPLTRSWWLASIGMFLWSCGYTLVAVNSISYRQQVTPERLLGRVNTAGRMLSWGVGWTFGALSAGLLGGLVGIQAAMVAMGGLEGVACLVAWASPLRTADETAAASGSGS